jgi:PKD repeat protein
MLKKSLKHKAFNIFILFLPPSINQKKRMKNFTHSLKKNYVTSLLLLVLVFGSIRILAQEEGDDPRYDRIPSWYIELMEDRPMEPVTIVTVNDYDNWNLGTDFAEGHISVNPRNPSQFFTVYNTNGTHHTEDGYTWAINNPSFGASMWGDPVSAYDSLGNLYYENMYGSGTIQGCKVVKSTNNGLNWSPSVTAIAGVDKNWITADQTNGPYANYVYTTMTANSGGNFARSTDNGATFQNTANLSTQNLPGMMPAVGAYGSVQGGAVYAVTNSGSSQASTYTFYRSTNGGQSFTMMSQQNWAGYVGTFVGGRNSVENMRTRPYPFVAADNSFGPNRGRLYCVYATNDPPGDGNKPDIYCRRSDDGGTTWSTAVKVNDDPNPTQHHQWMPAIWCEKETGKLYIQWMDTRDVPSSDSCYIYATYSDDGGVTFKANQRISNGKMKINCASCGGSGTPRYQGDYNGIAANPQGSMATWTDFRYGSFASFAGFFPDFAFKATPASSSFSYSDTFTVTVPGVKLYTNPVLVTTSIQTPPSGTFSFSYPNGFSINSFPGSIPVVITADNVPTGNYTVTFTGKGPNGTPIHKRTATITILPGAPPVADFEADTTTVCAGSTINFFDLSINSPSEWAWEFPGGEPATSTVKNPANILYAIPGKYNVTLTATNTQGSNTMMKADYITVNVVPEAPVLSEDVNLCYGEPVPDLSAEGENVKWYDDPELTNLVFEGNVYVTGITEPGVYDFYATQEQNDCISTADTVVLTIFALPEVTFAGLDSLCADDAPVTLTGGLPEGGTYSGTGVTDGIFDPAVAGVGTFEITYAYEDVNGCQSQAVQTITVNPLPVVELGADQETCTGGTVTFDAGAGFATYLWNNGAIEQSITVSEAGKYWIDITNEFGCRTSDTVSLAVNPFPGKTATPAGPAVVDLFLNPSSEFTTTGTENAGTYTWTIDPAGAGTISGNSLTGAVSWTNGFTGNATVAVKATNDCGDGEVSDGITVQVYSSQGIGENKIGEIKIYPNPNQGTFTLKINTGTEKILNIRIMNSLGEMIYGQKDVRVKGDFSQVISLNEIASGMLILKVDDGKDTWQGKVFIEK